jgi:hypothetical protein
VPFATVLAVTTIWPRSLMPVRLQITKVGVGHEQAFRLYITINGYEGLIVRLPWSMTFDDNAESIDIQTSLELPPRCPDHRSCSVQIVAWLP